MPAPRKGPTPPAARPRRTWAFWAGAIVLVVLGLVLLVALSLWQAARYVPPFYAQRTATPPTEADREAGDELERRVLSLKNQVKNTGPWQAVITEQQLNGWLAAHLAEKFPQALPEQFRDPRVQLLDGRALLAARVKQNGVESVLSLDITAYLTTQANEVGVEIHGLRAGLVPVPIKRLLDEGKSAADRYNVPLRWEKRGDDPVGIIRIPDHDREFGPFTLHLDSLAIQPGQIILDGHMEP